MMIEAQFLALTNRAAVTWTRDFQEHLNLSVAAISNQLMRAADSASLTDDNSSRNLARAAGPMAPTATTTPTAS